MSNRLESKLTIGRDRQRVAPIVVFASVHGHAQATVIVAATHPAPIGATDGSGRLR